MIECGKQAEQYQPHHQEYECSVHGCLCRVIEGGQYTSATNNRHVISIMHKKLLIKFTFWPTFLALLLLPMFMALGYWQLDRAKQKKELQEQYDARGMAPAIRLMGKDRKAEQLRFYRVVVEGKYETQHQILLDNRVHAAQAGYHVITPVHIKGSKTRVLVNRGWVPVGVDRGVLPDIKTPQTHVVIRGIATVPNSKAFLLKQPAPIIKGTWPKVWQTVDMRRVRQGVSYPVLPVVVLLDPDSKAAGFTREWRRLDRSISVHRGYAVQWYAMATAVIVGFVILAWRAAHSDDTDEEYDR